MGTETDSYLFDIKFSKTEAVKLNDPLMGTETKRLGGLLKIVTYSS